MKTQRKRQATETVGWGIRRQGGLNVIPQYHIRVEGRGKHLNVYEITGFWKDGINLFHFPIKMPETYMQFTC